MSPAALGSRIIFAASAGQLFLFPSTGRFALPVRIFCGSRAFGLPHRPVGFQSLEQGAPLLEVTLRQLAPVPSLRRAGPSRANTELRAVRLHLVRQGQDLAFSLRTQPFSDQTDAPDRVLMERLAVSQVDLQVIHMWRVGGEFPGLLHELRGLGTRALGKTRFSTGCPQQARALSRTRACVAVAVATCRRGAENSQGAPVSN